jgi:hypothetical protein
VFLEDLFLFAFHKLRMESSRLYTSGSESQDTGPKEGLGLGAGSDPEIAVTGQ